MISIPECVAHIHLEEHFVEVARNSTCAVEGGKLRDEGLEHGEEPDSSRPSEVSDPHRFVEVLRAPSRSAVASASPVDSTPLTVRRLLV